MSIEKYFEGIGLIKVRTLIDPSLGIWFSSNAESKPTTFVRMFNSGSVETIKLKDLIWSNPNSEILVYRFKGDEENNEKVRLMLCSCLLSQSSDTVQTEVFEVFTINSVCRSEEYIMMTDYLNTNMKGNYDRLDDDVAKINDKELIQIEKMISSIKKGDNLESIQSINMFLDRLVKCGFEKININ